MVLNEWIRFIGTLYMKGKIRLRENGDLIYKKQLFPLIITDPYFCMLNIVLFAWMRYSVVVCFIYIRIPEQATELCMKSLLI